MTTVDSTARYRTDQAKNWVSFLVGEVRYAVEIQIVREIVNPLPVVSLPHAPAEVMGVADHRGEVLPVIDLRRRLRLVEAKLDKNTRVLLVDTGDEILGLLVDAVLQVYRLYEDEVEHATTLGGDMNEYVMGIGRPRAVRTLGRSSSQDRDDPNDILILLHAEPLLMKR